jgi:hypothetical protein
MATGGGKKITNWRVEYLAVTEGGKKRVLGLEFLRGIEAGPRTYLMQILEAVKQSGGPQYWHDTNSHDKMEGELDDLHEARDKHGQTLYRLYLKWDSSAGVVWVLDGRTKLNNTALPKAEYDKIRALADTVISGSAVGATVEELVALLLN